MLRRLPERRVRSLMLGLRLLGASVVYLFVLAGAFILWILAAVVLSVTGLASEPGGPMPDWLFLAILVVGALMHSAGVWRLTTPSGDDGIRRLTRVGVLFAPLCLLSMHMMYLKWPVWVAWPLMALCQVVTLAYLVGLISWMGRLAWRSATWSPALKRRDARLRLVPLALLVPFALAWWRQAAIAPSERDHDWGLFWAMLFVVVLVLTQGGRVLAGVREELKAIHRGELTVNRT